MPRSPGGIADALQVQQFSDFELRGHGARNWTEAEDRWKETAAAVNFGQQDRRDRGQAGWVDDQRRGLPLFGRQRDRSQQFADLLVERPGVVEVGRHRDDEFDVAPDQFADAGKVCIGERMAEVEQEHHPANLGKEGNSVSVKPVSSRTAFQSFSKT